LEDLWQTLEDSIQDTLSVAFLTKPAWGPKTHLDTVAFAMHCKLRSSDVIPFVLRYDARTKAEVVIITSRLITFLLLVPYITLW